MSFGKSTWWVTNYATNSGLMEKPMVLWLDYMVCVVEMPSHTTTEGNKRLRSCVIKLHFYQKTLSKLQSVQDKLPTWCAESIRVWKGPAVANSLILVYADCYVYVGTISMCPSKFGWRQTTTAVHTSEEEHCGRTPPTSRHHTYLLEPDFCKEGGLALPILRLYFQAVGHYQAAAGRYPIMATY